MQEKLQIQVSAEEIESRITQLKAAILKIDPELPAATPHFGDFGKPPDGAMPHVTKASFAAANKTLS